MLAMKIEVRTEGFVFSTNELETLKEFNLVKQDDNTFHADLESQTALYKAITTLGYNNRLKLAMVEGERGCLMLVYKKSTPAS